MQIRTAVVSDASQVAELSAQLGYPVDVSALKMRLREAGGSSNGVVFVASRDDVVLGWMEVQKRHSVESGEWAEIVALVVDQKHRRAGAGRALVQAASNWAVERHFDRLRVRTNVIRDDAHAFYVSLGFEEKKRQVVREMKLGPGSA